MSECKKNLIDNLGYLTIEHGDFKILHICSTIADNNDSADDVTQFSKSRLILYDHIASTQSHRVILTVRPMIVLVMKS